MFCWNDFRGGVGGVGWWGKRNMPFIKPGFLLWANFNFARNFWFPIRKKSNWWLCGCFGWKAPVDFVVVCRERATLTIVFQAGSWGDAAGLEEGGGEVECPGSLPALQPSCLPSSQARGKARRRRRRRSRNGVASPQQPAYEAPAALPFR